MPYIHLIGGYLRNITNLTPPVIERGEDLRRPTTIERVRLNFHLVTMAIVSPILFGQTTAPAGNAPNADPPERWNLYYQATSIGQRHGTFNSPYEGPFSFQDRPERDVSLTTTLFFGLRLDNNTQL